MGPKQGARRNKVNGRSVHISRAISNRNGPETLAWQVVSLVAHETERHEPVTAAFLGSSPSKQKGLFVPVSNRVLEPFHTD